MSVISTERDAKALTLNITAEFEARPATVWKVWEDPRLLERWWGPPGWPATFADHDPVPGGWSFYYMTGPDGQRTHGWWNILTVEAPRLLEFEDGFADDKGAPDPSMPTMRTRVELMPKGSGTRMVVTSRFESSEAMAKVLDMGAEEGLNLAIGQIDAILADAL